jgi:PKD repeat protein
LEAPVITCETTNTSITFSWMDIAGASGYTVTVLDGPMGTQVGNSYEVTGLTPGTTVTIRVTAIDDGPCANVSSEATCIAAECPDVTVTIDDPGNLCADDAIQTLTTTIVGGVGGGTFMWQGTGIVDAMAGTFDPGLVNGTTTISVTYTEGVCTYSGSLVITVNPVPVASFTADSPVCIDGTSVVTFDGTASAGATYTWDFDGGTANPGTGEGPHDVSWATPGTKTISLTIEDNGCTSETFTLDVEVEEPLAAPVIICEETTSTSILFSWSDVPGATGYDITDLSGLSGTIAGNTYFLDNLAPGQEVTIQVVALGDGPCGNSMSEATCVAQDCPSLTIDVTGTDAICNGISPDPELTFDINAATGGPFTVEFTINSGGASDGDCRCQ